jgi:hypothetical protein
MCAVSSEQLQGIEPWGKNYRCRLAAFRTTARASASDLSKTRAKTGLARLDAGRVDQQETASRPRSAGSGRRHLLVELAAQPADLALGNAAHAERLDQIVHRAGGDAL